MRWHSLRREKNKTLLYNEQELDIIYFYITSANEVIMTLVYAMETNKINFEKEV